jgi:hypothetical protein
VEQFEKLVLLHVVIGGKPLIIDGFHEKLDPWIFNTRWLRDNHGDKSTRCLHTPVRKEVSHANTFQLKTLQTSPQKRSYLSLLATISAIWVC